MNGSRRKPCTESTNYNTSNPNPNSVPNVDDISQDDGDSNVDNLGRPKIPPGLLRADRPDSVHTIKDSDLGHVLVVVI
jgi:hypothetical protein